MAAALGSSRFFFEAKMEFLPYRDKRKFVRCAKRIMMKKRKIYSVIRGYILIILSEHVAWLLLALITLVIYLITLLF